MPNKNKKAKLLKPFKNPSLLYNVDLTKKIPYNYQIPLKHMNIQCSSVQQHKQLDSHYSHWPHNDESWVLCIH